MNQAHILLPEVGDKKKQKNRAEEEIERSKRSEKVHVYRKTKEENKREKN